MSSVLHCSTCDVGTDHFSNEDENYVCSKCKVTIYLFCNFCEEETDHLMDPNGDYQRTFCEDDDSSREYVPLLFPLFHMQLFNRTFH